MGGCWHASGAQTHGEHRKLPTVNVFEPSLKQRLMTKQIEANECYRRTDDNHLPDVSAQDIEQARIVLGLNNRGGGPAANT